MKAKLEYRVPLSQRAVASGLVFPPPTGRVLSDSTLSELLRELRIGAVSHGFRSSFRDWAAERSDLFEKRRELMAEWGDYLT